MNDASGYLGCHVVVLQDQSTVADDVTVSCEITGRMKSEIKISLNTISTCTLSIITLTHAIEKMSRYIVSKGK